MTLDQEIQELYPLVNYHDDADVRHTLMPYDFRRSLEHGIRQVGKYAPLIERTFGIPMVALTRTYKIDMTTYDPWYEWVNLKDMYIIVPTGGVVPFPEVEVGGIERGAFANLLEWGTTRDIFGIQTWLQQQGFADSFRWISRCYQQFTVGRKQDRIEMSEFIADQPVAGTLCTILTKTDAKNFTMTPNPPAGMDNTWVGTNLSRVNYLEHNNQVVASSSGAAVVFGDNTVNWSVGDLVYFTQTNIPGLLCFFYQGIVKQLYFEQPANTVMPYDDKYKEEVFVYAKEYLLQLLASRFPKKYTQLWTLQKQLTKQSTRDAQKAATSRSSFTKVKFYGAD